MVTSMMSVTKREPVVGTCIKEILGVLVFFEICSPGWPQTHNLPPSTPECWDYRCVPPHLAQEINFKTSFKDETEISETQE
jgi:hypothetical protein